MNQIQKALAEALEKYGQTDYKNRRFATIPLHRISEYNLENAETLMTLPYSSDDSEAIKYDVRRVDELINLHIWKQLAQ